MNASREQFSNPVDQEIANSGRSVERRWNDRSQVFTVANKGCVSGQCFGETIQIACSSGAKKLPQYSFLLLHAHLKTRVTSGDPFASATEYLAAIILALL